MNTNPALLGIGELAAASGLAPSAIRYYEAAGLLKKPRRISGKRFYNPDSVDRLMLIRFCARLGISLDDVRKLLAVPRGDRAKDHWRHLVDSQLEQITSLITAAQGVERVLLESRECDCVTPQTCRFLKEEREKPAPTRRRLGLHDALKAELV
ncbi:MAG: MerR family transcriptional regulator [Candidatus Dormibacteraeota bacterium]|nr:MerR family transcriptional regulator [Candidatus Dormibacteraeota bacterium]